MDEIRSSISADDQTAAIASNVHIPEIAKKKKDPLLFYFEAEEEIFQQDHQQQCPQRSSGIEKEEKNPKLGQYNGDDVDKNIHLQCETRSIDNGNNRDTQRQPFTSDISISASSDSIASLTSPSHEDAVIVSPGKTNNKKNISTNSSAKAPSVDDDEEDNDDAALEAAVLTLHSYTAHDMDTQLESVRSVKAWNDLVVPPGVSASPPSAFRSTLSEPNDLAERSQIFFCHDFGEKSRAGNERTSCCSNDVEERNDESCTNPLSLSSRRRTWHLPQEGQSLVNSKNHSHLVDSPPSIRRHSTSPRPLGCTIEQASRTTERTKAKTIISGFDSSSTVANSSNHNPLAHPLSLTARRRSWHSPHSGTSSTTTNGRQLQDRNIPATSQHLQQGVLEQNNATVVPPLSEERDIQSQNLQEPHLTELSSSSFGGDIIINTSRPFSFWRRLARHQNSAGSSIQGGNLTDEKEYSTSFDEAPCSDTAGEANANTSGRKTILMNRREQFLQQEEESCLVHGDMSAWEVGDTFPNRRHISTHKKTSSSDHSHCHDSDEENDDLKQRKITMEIQKCKAIRFPFKKKLSFSHMNLTPKEIPLSQLLSWSLNNGRTTCPYSSSLPCPPILGRLLPQSLCLSSSSSLGENLHSLDLSRNPLGYLPDLLVTSFPVLIHLNLNHCNLHTLPEVWDLPRLQELTLSHNSLRVFPGESMLTGLPELRDLDLCHNKLTVIAISERPLMSSSCCYPDSTRTTTKDNDKRNDKEKCGLFPELQVLNLGFNELSGLSSQALGRFPSLRELNVSNNFITEIPANVVLPGGDGSNSLLPLLKTIDASSNPIRIPPLESVERGLASMRRYYTNSFQQQSEETY